MAQAKSGLRYSIYHRTLKNVNAVNSRLYGIFSLSADDLGDDEQPKAVTYVSQRVLGRMEIVKVGDLTDKNMVTIRIDNIEITLSTWILSWKIRRHRTSEFIARADIATLPVS